MRVRRLGERRGDIAKNASNEKNARTRLDSWAGCWMAASPHSHVLPLKNNAVPTARQWEHTPVAANMSLRRPARRRSTLANASACRLPHSTGRQSMLFVTLDTYFGGQCTPTWIGWISPFQGTLVRNVRGKRNWTSLGCWILWAALVHSDGLRHTTVTHCATTARWFCPNEACCIQSSLLIHSPAIPNQATPD